MIRLTQQFDPAYARASAASPKSSGCSSCCCCCVVTILGASVITARSIHALSVPAWTTERPELPPSFGATRSAPPPPPAADLWIWKLFGFLLLPASLAVGIALDYSTSAFPIFISLGLATWLGGLLYLVVTNRLKWSIALSIAVLTVVVAFLEAILYVRFY